MLCYTELFDALASARIDLANTLAEIMGGRDVIEKKHDHPFDYALGYTLKAFVLNDRVAMTEWSKRFVDVTRQTTNRDFLGYADVFQAILMADPIAAQAGLKHIVKGHEKQSKGSGVFRYTPDEVLCVWGIGMANLARVHGLMVQGVPPLIPDELLEREKRGRE